MARTVIEIQTELALWRAAELKCAAYQSATVAGKTFTRANISEIEKVIKRLLAELTQAEAEAAGRPRGIVNNGTRVRGMGY